MHTYMHTMHIYIHTYTHTYTYIHTYMHACILTYFPIAFPSVKPVFVAVETWKIDKFLSNGYKENYDQYVKLNVTIVSLF